MRVEAHNVPLLYRWPVTRSNWLWLGNDSPSDLTRSTDQLAMHQSIPTAPCPHPPSNCGGFARFDGPGSGAFANLHDPGPGISQSRGHSLNFLGALCKQFGTLPRGDFCRGGMAQIILTLLDCSFVVGVFMGRRERKLGCLVLLFFFHPSRMAKASARQLRCLFLVKIWPLDPYQLI